MSLLVIGLSHHTAPIELLESVAAVDASALAHRVTGSAAVTESLVLTTCNRLEVYADAVTFHGAVAAIGEALALGTGVSREELTSHLYVHYEDRAVAHVFAVACGLDSMAVGEAQILGQLREALHTAQRLGTLGSSLNALTQQALRVGKRAHSDTGIDAVSRSLVEAALDQASNVVGPIADSRVLVVGAGGMSSLAATTVARRGVARLTIANRTAARAHRLAEATGGHTVAMSGLDAAIADADVVVSSTGSVGHLIEADQVARASAGRGGRPQVFVDLALPRDVDPAVAHLPGVTVVSLGDLQPVLAARAEVTGLPEVQAVRDLVTAEVADFLARRMVKSVAPTVVALRARAAAVVDAELARLDQKLPALDDATRDEVQRTVHRIVEKLLHTPTVRIKELTSDGHGDDYVTALRELFDLDPHVVAAVSTLPDASTLLAVDGSLRLDDHPATGGGSA